MDVIYRKLFAIAAPHLKKGRRYDYFHTKVVLPFARQVVEKEGLDGSIIIPAFIFHDIGWSQVGAKMRKNYRSEAARHAHMKQGAVFAKELLIKFKYPLDKIKRIAYIVSVHDYQSEGVRRVLTDNEALAVASLDFLWRATKWGFWKDIRERNEEPRAYLHKLRVKAIARNLPHFSSLYKIFLMLARQRALECANKKTAH